MKLKNIRTGRLISVQAPVFLLARERNLAEEDIIGIPNHGSLSRLSLGSIQLAALSSG